jgi:hypothetical protein
MGNLRAYPNCNLDHLTELAFEFDQTGEIIDCTGTIKDGESVNHDYAGSGLARLYETARRQFTARPPAQRYCNFQTARGGIELPHRVQRMSGHDRQHDASVLFQKFLVDHLGL